MPLAQSQVPTNIASDEVEEVPGDIPRGRGQRPKIWKLLPDGSESRDEMVEMTRASSLGDALENKYLIHRWDMRNLAFALSRRPDLVLKLAAVPDIEEKANKNEVHETVKVALDFAGGTAAATSGSAIHRLSERLDAGEDLSYLADRVLEALTVYRRLMSTLRIVASETFVVCDELGAAGTYDRVVELLNDTEVRWRDADGVERVVVLPAGTRLILDLKTNANAMYFGAVYACQEAVYGFGVPYTHEGGRGEWPDGLAPSREWGLLLHLPIDSLEDAGFYWVDLTQGYNLAIQAAAHREAMKKKDLFWPTDLEPIPVKSTLAVGAGETITATAEVLSVTRNEAIETAEDEIGVPISEAACTFHGPHPMTVDCPECMCPDLLEAIAGAQDEDELTALWEKHEGIWGDEHSAAAKARIHDLYADDPLAAAPTDLLTSEEIEVEVPLQVRRTGLIASIRHAKSEAAMTVMWESNQDIWDASCTRMVKVRLRELEAAPS